MKSSIRARHFTQLRVKNVQPDVSPWKLILSDLTSQIEVHKKQINKLEKSARSVNASIEAGIPFPDALLPKLPEDAT
jgi:hypothetical protein